MKESEELLTRVHKIYQINRSARAHVGFLVTTKCPVGCKHCISNAGETSWEEPDARVYSRWIHSVSEAGMIKVVSLTGGEPFVIFENLLDITLRIRHNAMLPTVLTSGYWANSERITDNRIKQLVSAGLYALSVSVDEFHQEKIPIENVQRVIKISKHYGLKVGLSYRYHGVNSSTKDVMHKLKNILGESLKYVDSTNLGMIQKTGRARTLLFPSCGYTDEYKQIKMCSAIMPLIWPDGTVTGCCGPSLPRNSPLILGNLDRESFIKIYRRFEEHPLLPFIEVLGLRQMIKYLQEVGLGRGLEEFDTPEEVCHLCLKIFSNDENVRFFVRKFNDLKVRRELGVKRFFVYGDPKLFLRAIENHENYINSKSNLKR